ncbi:PTS sugar transporter subunit IIA [Pseudomonadales bacterium]|nr:PTS sugar transporter subunit IIA [Pseudomonadales bacterium]MDA9298359.1 PTS sugar transporter subunit IIA [Pseudomonadales bacterium]MDA9315997.1 PTS sugar transporter subunit IIA [Pseudomonadales bacterium]MDB4068893.1 PTS sugar transporter subunit IIA [Pseudomonadales bacterium]MDB4151309.1 PTS sugar transporter subunit IIA [Pseudomonadales bacterium]
MNIESILSLSRTHANIQANSKKRAIEEAAKLIAASMEGLDAEEIYNSLIAREKLGTTAIGHGIAIPHCRLSSCQEIVGSLISIQDPVDFEAFDDQGVNLMFVMLVPSEEVEEHLQALAMLAERFETKSYRDLLSAAENHQALFERAILPLTPSTDNP